MNVDWILFHLYGLIGMHFNAMMRVGRDGMTETVFQYFELEGFMSGTNELI
jgi:hypothetical protein